MENINELVDYLKPNRRRIDPAEKLRLTRVTENYIPIVVQEDETLSIEPIFGFEQKYKKFNLPNTHGSYCKLYVKNAGGGIYRYYVQTESLLYKRIERGVTHFEEVLTIEEYDGLTPVNIKGLGFVYWEDATDQIHILNVPGVVVTPTFPYDPAHLSPLINGKMYTLDYVNYLGDREGGEHAESYAQRRVTLNYHSEKGAVEKYPLIHLNETRNKITIYYEYYKIDGELVDSPQSQFASIFGPEIRNPKKKHAIKLEFLWNLGFLAFVKSVYFENDNGEAPVFASGSKEERFYTQYIEIIKKMIFTDAGSSNEIYKVFYYMPISMLAKLETNYLWGFLDRQISWYIANTRILKEDIAVTLLRALAVRLSPRAFLEALLKPRGGTKSKPRLYLLVDKLDGYNFTAYVNIVWEAWRKTNYSKLNPRINHAMDTSGNAPTLLPYKSDKTIGFHHDNASIDLSDNHKKIDVEIDLEKAGIVNEVSLSIFGWPTITPKKGMVTVTENYSYDPFAPLVIVNEINPHFIFKDQSGGAGMFTILPAFVLFSREKRAFWSNSALAAEYIVDVLTLVTGIGSVLKAGRIFKLLKSGKSILFMSKNATTATGYALKSKGIIEITSGVGNTLLKLTGANETEAGKAVSEYFFYLELLSMGGELTEVFQQALKKAAFKAAKSSDEIIRLLENTDDAVKKYTDDLSRLEKLNDAAVNLSIDTYYALIHLWETAGIIARNFEQFTEQVKLALMELNIQIFDVLTHDIDDIFNRLFPRFAMSSDGAIEKVVMYNDEVLFAGTKKQFNEFAAKIGEAAAGGINNLKHFLDDLAESLSVKYEDVLNVRNFKIIREKGAQTKVSVIDEMGNVRMRGTKSDIEKYLEIMKLDDTAILKKYEEILRKAVNSDPKRFNPFKYKLKKYREEGVFIKKSGESGGVLGGRGLVPDFLHTPQFLYKGEAKYGKIKIKLTGVDKSDFKLCFEKAGITDKNLIKSIDDNYTWHHMDDYDPITGECTMQLVERSVHIDSFPHKGAPGLIYLLFGIKRG